eukprot:TRINITY_DN54104_c0_g1_i1.p1 TRINITY_DN54104_c0_g1~~TRINITY_DN54104_c0_g1_i1.p1  ORF type:complete len:281 (+),score=34.84 TRINITY_DN54104_c0_g1_i1:33-875(+)
MAFAEGSRKTLAIHVLTAAAGTGIVAFLWHRRCRLFAMWSDDTSSQENEQAEISGLSPLSAPNVRVLNPCDLADLLDLVPSVMEYFDVVDLCRARTLGLDYADMCGKGTDIISRQHDAWPSQGTNDHGNSDCASFFTMLDTISGEHDIQNVASVFMHAKSKPYLLDTRDCAGRSPLMRSAHAGPLRLMKALLAARAELCARGGNGWRPLHYAAVSGRVDKCRLLLDRRADINARSTDSFTALAYAREAGHDNIVTELLFRGADPCLFDKKEGGGGDAGVG